MKTIEEAQLPNQINLSGIEPEEFVSYYRANKGEIEDALPKIGALKFTGVHIDNMDVFQELVNAISDKFMQYIDGNSPRTKLSDTVYTSTEYDQSQKITMHNELSYSAKWPNKLFFSCLQPAISGGETLLADSRSILQNMDPSIVAKIREKGIVYIRNLHGGMGMGPSWQDTFETESKQVLESYCKAASIEYKWGENGNIKLLQHSPGIIRHRSTSEEVWFNQIDQFHPCHLGEEMLETMKIMYDSPADYPMYVTFGDGTDISESLISEVLQTIDSVTYAPAWKQNELLIIDNELVSHGRSPFTGDRKVLVAMSE